MKYFAGDGPDSNRLCCATTCLPAGFTLDSPEVTPLSNTQYLAVPTTPPPLHIFSGPTGTTIRLEAGPGVVFSIQTSYNMIR